jgi:hypothetical protein
LPLNLQLILIFLGNCVYLNIYIICEVYASVLLAGFK